jgi:hypothetical protein
VLLVQRDLGECVELLDEMERNQKMLEDENATLKAELHRLSVILAARETELLKLKGITAAEESF